MFKKLFAFAFLPLLANSSFLLAEVKYDVHDIDTLQTHSSEAMALTNEKVVYITRTGKKYHCVGCRYLKSVISIDRFKALELGYTPCKVCRPN